MPPTQKVANMSFELIKVCSISSKKKKGHDFIINTFLGGGVKKIFKILLSVIFCPRLFSRRLRE